MMGNLRSVLHAIINAQLVQEKPTCVSSAKEIDLDLYAYVQVKPMMMV